MRIKLAIIAIAIVCCTHLYSQKKSFVKGYYIDSKNNKVECLIKDEDWQYNPTQIVYRTDENSASQVISVNDFQEFGVNEFKYIKANVKIDRSSDHFENVSGTKALDLVEENLLVRVLVEGDANLYSYSNENITRFFYSQGSNASIAPLSYKLYYDDDEKVYRKNETYKQELLNALKCDKIGQADVEGLQYGMDKLRAFFIKYNTCKGSLVNEFKEKKVINTFDFYAKAGIGISSATYKDGNITADFGNKPKFRVAFEAEVNLSNKGKKYSLLLEPSYQYYKSSVSLNGVTQTKIDYKAIDLSVGFRRYFAINTNSLVFVNAYITYGYTLSSEIGPNKIDETYNTAIGVGYLYNKRYVLEMRYDLERDLMKNYNFQSARYHSIGLSFGYKFH